MDETLKIITWPHVIFLFAIVFVLLFREQISHLIKRTTSIDKKGLKAGPSPESQREQPETTNNAVQHLLSAVGDSVVINEQEGNIQKDLEEKGLSTDGDTVKVLIKHLAGTQLLLVFEKILSSIFGSQIVLLKQLNEVRGQGINVEIVNWHIETTKESHPVELGDWTADQYLSFLRSYLLIIGEDQIQITNLGVEYLTWMARIGHSENKLL